ncbi:MAG: hypothetical protein HY897_17685 [Deltaproteobacteria bacterium]|nr:hypothetical protein [Deltaproteobacteria bacterium]
MTDSTKKFAPETGEAIARLNALARDCAKGGWDGCDARPIGPEAVARAEMFVQLLPPGFPVPEFAPEPDGSVSLDWIRSRDRLFSLSVGDSDQLAYAWLDGDEKGHGVESFVGQSVPERLLVLIETVTDRDE